MKKSIAIRFGIAAALLTSGCLLWMSNFSEGGLLVGFSMAPLMPRSEWTRPMLRRELWLVPGLVFGSLFALIVIFVAAKHFVPSSVLDVMERVIHHPAVIVPLWLFTLRGLLRHAQSERGESDA